METFPVTPLNNNVYIQEEKQEESTTSGGIVINANSGQPISGLGRILAISDATIKFLKDEQDVDIKVGSKVYFSRFSAEDVIHIEDGVMQKGIQKLHVSSLAGILNDK